MKNSILWILIIAVAAGASVAVAAGAAPLRSGLGSDLGVATKSPRQDVPEILSAIPAEAWLVVTARNLKGIDAKIITLLGQLDLPFPFSAVEQLQFRLGLGDGLDTGGDLALIMMPPQESSGPIRWGSGLAMLLPARNRNALLAPLNPVPAEEGLVKVVMRGRDTYVGVKGSFAVLGPDAGVVRAIIKAGTGVGERWTAHQLARYGDNDLSVWVNAEAISSSQRFERFAEVMTRRGLNQQMLKSVRSLQLSLRLSPKGLFLEQFVRGAGTAAAFSETDSSLLTGLPADGFLAAWGLRMGSDGTVRGLTKLLGTALQSSSLLDQDAARELVAAYADVAGGVEIVSVSVNALPPGPDGLASTTKIVRTGSDARAWLTKVAGLVQRIKGTSFRDARINAILERVEYTAGAEKIGETPVDQLRIDLSDVERVDDERLKAVVGREGILVRLAAVDDTHVVIHLGGGLKQFETVAKGVKSGQPGLAADAGIKKSSESLRRQRFAEGYLAADRFLGLARNIADAWGQQAPPVSMADLNAPVGVVLRDVGDGAIEGNVLIPIELLVAVKAAILEAAARSIGGPPAGR